MLHQEAGDTHEAEASTLRAAAAGRSADETTRANQLANTARCLLELETEIGRSRDLIREGSAIVDSASDWSYASCTGRGDCCIDGMAKPRRPCIHRPRSGARPQGRRPWREYKCLTWLAMLEQELGRYAEMQARCAELRTVAARLGEDETPFVATLQALALLAAGNDLGELTRLRMPCGACA